MEYINRELSWIRFNERVLEEAEDESNPLLERLKFLAIFSNNLDEFFMVRVAGLRTQINAGVGETSVDGMTPRMQIAAIHSALLPLLDRQADLLHRVILPRLSEHGVKLCGYAELSEAEKAEADHFFNERIFPVLTPLAVDPAHPVPQLRGLNLNLLVELQKNGVFRRAVVPIPPPIPRFFSPKSDKHVFVAVETIVERHIGRLFTGMEAVQMACFRLTRNADLDIAEAEAEDLLTLIESELKKRRLGAVIRLEYHERMSVDRFRFLIDEFDLEPEDVYPVRGYLGLEALFGLPEKIDLPALKDSPFMPAPNEHIAAAPDIFSAIRAKDIVLHHPYDSFGHITQLLTAAAVDPNVLAIKQTLYRTGGRSPIVDALKAAAENGKQVTALIEIKARFDEQTNIYWARELEQAGVIVVYGIMGLKTHCKMTLILRNEQGTLRSYLHLGTGNYNEKTALIYTDISLLTCEPELGADVAELFNLLTGYSEQKSWRKIFVAPANIRENFVDLIKRCIDMHSPQKPSKIELVMNSLVDPDMIRWLYDASEAGVKVDLTIRGICCLVPINENITVRSIVGRFLEHCRIYSFAFGDEHRVYAGSTDWMRRNLNRRIEVVYPLERPEIKDRVYRILKTMQQDTAKARILGADGIYRKPSSPDGFSAQLHFLNEARKKNEHSSLLT
jgi:polyphosphate kinase